VRTVSYAEMVGRVTVADLFGPVAEALRMYSRGRASVAAVGLLNLDRGGDVHIKSAAVAGDPYFVVKVASAFPHNAADGLPSANGAVVVFHAGTGEAVAFIEDRGELTDLRTAAAGALATNCLAVSGPLQVGIVGTGVQARLQAQALLAVRPVASLRVWGRRPSMAESLAADLASSAPTGCVLEVATSVQALVDGSQVLITATSSREPLVLGAWLHAGQHITAVGADDLAKAELDAACFGRADVVVVDSRSQNESLGELGRMARDGRPTHVDAELGEVLDGSHPGRTSTRQITIAKLTGIGVQDVAAARTLLERLGPTSEARTAPGLS
jgi:ornithine cyclodeaminase